jgi:lipid II:glycine glycyltransferase (peptidoglycan interpeptide bridge formation enzyme)
MPYCIKKRSLFTYITMPQLTQTLGPYIIYPPSQKYEKRLAYEKEVLDALFDQLPPFDSFEQSFHYEITNWLPLYWRGFKQTTKYTYVIEDLSDMSAVVQNFSKSTRVNIKNTKEHVTIKEDLDLKTFHKINQTIFQKQGLELFYSFDLVKRIDDACKKQHCRKIFYATDSKNNILSIDYIIWDHQSVYSIMGGVNPEFRNSHASSLLELEKIKFASRFGLKFDFEGSMLEGVEEYNRRYGSVQKPYLQISKVNAKSIKIRHYLKSLFS